MFTVSSKANDATHQCYFEHIHAFNTGGIRIHGLQFWQLPQLLPIQEMIADSKHYVKFRKYIIKRFDRKYKRLPNDIYDLIFKYQMITRDCVRRELVRDCYQLAKQLSHSKYMQLSFPFCMHSPYCSFWIELAHKPFVIWNNRCKSLELGEVVDTIYEYVLSIHNFDHVFALSMIISFSREQLEYCFNHDHYKLLILYAKLLEYIDKEQYSTLLRGVTQQQIGNLDPKEFRKMFHDSFKSVVMLGFHKTWKDFIWFDKT